MKCPKCQTENREGAQFCRVCGQSLQQELKCPKCGHINLHDSQFCDKCGSPLALSAIPSPTTPPTPVPSSFINGRYKVKKFLGEGGKKKVYLAYDTVLDRDVAFALIKTEKLDESARTRVIREAQAMGKLGDHPNIVGIFDMGEEKGQPYVVLPLMPGGDVEALIEKAPERRLPIDKAIGIAKNVCKGLEYAHGKGIIHRDIKPGNIWLGTDGTAKIGDFGLAIATELSRLTKSGMMVGTYYYMPPEQAMGGEVTAKADLYSLGAMLYEMVTGRPPFTGDDSVAIIGQHINTPPVSPSWHRPDLPSPLAALILRLLEKDPQKRLASASEVLKALEAIETGKALKVSSEQAEALAENPLYRRVFVGREPELRQLQSAFDNAVSGQGALTMVVGEPGIGKTALTEQLATYVSLRGGKTLVGHCYEEGSLSLPYLAFVEALRTYATECDITELRKELGTGAGDVARIVSEVRERLKVQPRPKVNPEEERYRLMQAVTDFLGNAAKAQPLLIVLEDLHSADRGTLEMLEHVARNLADKRLLLVGTYRDVEVDRTHPLSAALAELRRLPAFGRVLLRGLNADEVRRMLSSITGQEVPWGLAKTVHRQTEGNPLFVQEVVRYLVEEGVVTREKGQWQAKGDTPVEMRIPDGLRDVIGKRLSGLSESCNKVLSIAAVIGRDFRLEVLQKVAGITDEELFKALEEARRVAVVEERTGAGATVNYRFAHAFFRQTLYEEIIAPRRIRLHQQVARALEEIFKTRLEEHATELTEHFSYSSDSADLKKAVSYGEMAAKRAVEVYAWGEAVRLLEQTIKVQEILDTDDKGKRCDLLLELADSLLLNGEPRRALDNELTEAFSLVEAMSTNERTTRVSETALKALIFFSGALAPTWASEEGRRWADRADRYAVAGTAGRALADAGLGCMKYSTGHFKTGISLLREALSQARNMDDNETFWIVAQLWILFCRVPQLVKERLHIAEEIEHRSRISVIETVDTAVLASAGDILLEYGQRQRAEVCFREYKKMAERTRQVNLRLHSMEIEAIEKYMSGALTEAVQIVEAITKLGEEANLAEFAYVMAVFPGLRPLMALGMDEEVNKLLRQENYHMRALWYANQGQSKRATQMVDRFLSDRPDIGTPDDYGFYWADVIWLEAACIVSHKRACELLLCQLAERSPKTTGFPYLTCIPRHLGGACALLERYDEARKYYYEAIKVCTDMRFRPELALSRLQLAELLLEHYPKEKSEAIAHLDFVIPEFRDMKMRPSLERALRHKEILKA
jgi:tetratricopeptide (TPR) repeat protein